MKIKPFIKQFREGPGSDEFLLKMETLLNSTPALKKRVTWMEVQFKKWAEMMKAKAAGKS